MIKNVSDCNGCETCRNCGRKNYNAVFCDKCGGQIDFDSVVFGMGSQDICSDCIYDAIIAELESERENVIAEYSEKIAKECGEEFPDNMDLAYEFFSEVCEYMGIEEVKAYDFI